MKNHAMALGSHRWFVQLAMGVFISLVAFVAQAQDDPPGRVGRLADVQGNVSWFDHHEGQWRDAERNLPLTGGDRVATAAQGRVELRIGSSVLRVGGNSEVEVLRLDDQRISVQVHSGSLALRVRSREIADEIELVTNEARLLPASAGHFRVDRVDDTTQVSSWRGDVRVDDPAGFVLVAGQRVDLHRQVRTGELRAAWASPVNDAFATWVSNDEQRDERSASARYVSPEMTGAEELDRNGRWEQHPEYGAVWLPLVVRADWAPYRHGRWTWVRPWGWTWVDEAPWGFAPFHYGRWAHWRGRWCWAPGAYAARPVYAPALVAWVGGPPSVNINVRIGGGGFVGGTVGWVPLAPREVFVPRYSVTPGYRDRINPLPSYRWHHSPHHAPTGPIMYGNQGVTNGVTIVSHEVLMQRQPVARAWDAGRQPGHEHGRDAREEQRRRGEWDALRRQPLTTVAPPAPVAAVTPQPGVNPGQMRPTWPRDSVRQEQHNRQDAPANAGNPRDRAPPLDRGQDRAQDRGPDRGQDRGQDRRPDRNERPGLQMVPGGAVPVQRQPAPQAQGPAQGQPPMQVLPPVQVQQPPPVQSPNPVGPPPQNRPVPPPQGEGRRDRPDRPERRERDPALSVAPSPAPANAPTVLQAAPAEMVRPAPRPQPVERAQPADRPAAAEKPREQREPRELREAREADKRPASEERRNQRERENLR
jgi:FecR protein